MYLLMQILSLDDEMYYKSASHFGQAMSILTLLRGTYHHLQNQSHYFPQDLCKKHELRNNQIFMGDNIDSIKLVTKEMVDCIEYHFEQANINYKQFDKLYKKLMLMDTGNLKWLKKLKKMDYNIYGIFKYI